MGAVLEQDREVDARDRFPPPLVVTHQTATACGHPFTALLTADTTNDRPQTAAEGATYPLATAVAKALTYGIADTNDPHLIQDIAAAVNSLQPEPHTGRQPALTR